VGQPDGVLMLVLVVGEGDRVSEVDVRASVDEVVGRSGGTGLVVDMLSVVEDVLVAEDDAADGGTTVEDSTVVVCGCKTVDVETKAHPSLTHS